MNNETRIATWKQPPARPRSSARQVLAEGFHPVKPIWEVAIGLPLLGVLLGAFSSLEALGNALLLGTLPACVIAAIWSYTRKHVHPYADPIPTHDHGDGLPRINVAIRLGVEGYQYGEDRGELTLVDDWLVFEGERTSFSLAPHDVSAFLRGSNEFGREPVGMRIKDVTADVQLWIMATDPFTDVGRFLEWWSVKTVPAAAISLLPPLSPMPGYRKWWLRRIGTPRDLRVRNSLKLLLPIYIVGVANTLGVLHEFHPTLAVACVTVLAVILGVTYQRRGQRRALDKLAEAMEAVPANCMFPDVSQQPLTAQRATERPPIRL